MTLPLAAALLLAATPAPGRPYTIQDQVALRRVSSPRVSPDGRHVAFVLRSTDLAANRGRRDVWRVGLDGADARPLTDAPEDDHDPVWAPDGQSLLFLSARGGSTQVWRVPAGGGEAQALTRLPLDVGAFALSRDGAWLAVALEVYPDCPGLACTVERLEAEKKRQATGRLWEGGGFVRHWDSWTSGRRSHLFVLPLAGDGTPVDVMRGMDADCPSKPFGGAEDFTFTPDGSGVVFSARAAGAAEPWSTDLDLFLAPRDGSSPPRKLTADNRATDTAPTFSPDGKTLASLAMRRPGYESDRLRVVLRAWPDGAARTLTEGWDASAERLAWSADGRTLYTVAYHLGEHPLFGVDVESGRVRRLSERGYVDEPQAAADGRLVYLRDDLLAPADVYSARAQDGGEVRPLTRVNAEALAAVRFGEAQPFDFPGWRGDPVHGWLVKPVGFDPARRYPVAFLVHGGPQGSFSNHFHYRWNPQVYAGAGYAVVMVDFHGSVGYGQAFTDSIRGDWGGKPLEDLQKGLAAALRRFPFLHPERVCALGASYGGYMVNWMAGRLPERFRCFVNHAGTLDQRFAYFDTEELWFPEWEMRGTPWQNPAAYERHNPIRHVERWKTPMLVIHGGQDFRVVETQGLATFNALQRRGIPARLLYFPDENHWVVKPANSVQWHEVVLDWLGRWTAGP